MFMDRDFLKQKCRGKGRCIAVLVAGTAVSLLLACLSWRESSDGKANRLLRNPAGEGAYEQEMIAKVEGAGKIPMIVTVEERCLTKEEAEKELSFAAEILPEILKGENESLQKVTKELDFTETVPGTIVDVSWQDTAPEYFSADGKRRKDVRLTEPETVLLTAELRCQEERREFLTEVTLYAQEETAADRLAAEIFERSRQSAEEKVLYLPEKYSDGTKISWRKPTDLTFVYIFLLTLLTSVLLMVGEKRDKQMERQKEKEELERDYAGLISKFTLLLSAGLSIRNAWERITVLYENGQMKKGVLYGKLLKSLRELQKGVPETQVYENFGSETGLIHYKKLMALFISDKKRGSVPLQESLEKEMLQAWEEKKRQTRQRGEKAEAKLLFPMIGMLSVVFMMILIPAFMSLRM